MNSLPRVWRQGRRSKKDYSTHKFRPLQLEPLEIRTLLATLAWDGGGDGLSWNDPLNWNEDRAPSETDDVIIDVPGDQLIRVRGNQPVVKSVTNHETIHIDGNRSTGAARLTVSGVFTNYGVIRLETTSDDHHDRSSQLVVSEEGLLLNTASGLIDVRVGAGERRQISASIVNQGTLVVEQGTSLTVTNGPSGFRQMSGEIAAHGELLIVGSNFDFVNGDIEGLVRLQSADIYVGDSVTDSATLRAVGPSGKLRGNEATNVTLWIEGTTRFGVARLATQEGAVNRGTIRLETSTNDHHDRGSYLSIIGSTFTNENGGLIDIRQGAGDGRTVTGHLTNRGQVDVGPGETAEFFGTLVSDGGRYSGDLRLRDVQLSVLRAPDEPTELRLFGGHNVLHTDIPVGQTLSLLGTTTYGTARLRSPNGFVNSGHLRLETTSNDHHDRGAYLTVTEGTLVNSEQGTIDIRAGEGDPRWITGNITNRGSLLVENGTTLIVSNADRSFRQENGHLQALGQVRVENGIFDFIGGEIDGLVRLLDTDLLVHESVTDETTLRAVGESGVLRSNLGEHVTVWIEGTTTWGDAILNTTEDARNLGTIRLETTSNDHHDRGSYLRIGGTTFINEPQGAIDIRQGEGDGRSITGHLTNRGQVKVGAGETADLFGTLISDGGRYSGDLRLRDVQLSFLREPDEPTILQLFGSNNVLHTDIPSGQTLHLLGTTTYGDAQLRSPNGFVNSGNLRLETISNDHHDRGVYLTITEGTLVNSAQGTIDVRTGEGDPRGIVGSVINRGSIAIEAGTTLSVTNTDLFQQEQGSLRADGEFRLVGGAFDFTNGNIDGLVRLLNADVFIAETVTDDSTLRLIGDGGRLRGNLSEDTTVWVEGTTTWGKAVLKTTEDSRNRGTIRLETTSDDHHDRGSYLQIGGETFLNEHQGVIDIREGAGDGRSITGHFTNRGRLIVDTGETANFFGTLVSDGGTYEGDLRLHNVQLSFLRPPSSPTALQLFNSGNVLHTDIPPGQTVSILGTVTYGEAQLLSPFGFTNYGRIHLETTSNDHHDRRVQLVTENGTLLNAPQGVIDVRAGKGDARIIRGQLRNEGTVIVDTSTTLTGTAAEHLNVGVISLLAGTLTVHGASFQNAEAALIGGGGNLNTAGLDFQNLGTVDLSRPSVANVELDPGLLVVHYHSIIGMDPDSASHGANYQLIGSGGDGTFHDGNEQDFTTLFSTLSFDPTNQVVSFQLEQALEQDAYRLLMDGTEIVDLNGTPLLLGQTVAVMRHLGQLPTLVEIDLQETSDSGLFNDDNLTNVTAPNFDVTVNRAGTIMLDVNGDEVADVAVQADAPGTYVLTSPVLPHGVHTVTAHFAPTFGETVSSALQVTVDVLGPHLVTGRSAEQAPATERNLEFNERLDPVSSVAALELAGPDGLVTIESVEISGSQMLVAFAPVVKPGDYVLSADAHIRDLAGNLLDQNHNGVNGEQEDSITDRFTLLADVTAPFIAGLTPSGPLNVDLTTLSITFNERMQTGSFTTDDLQMISPTGPVDLSGSIVTQLDAWKFEISIPSQSLEGTYQIAIGPHVRDLSVNPMAATHHAVVELDKTGPRVTSITPAGTISEVVDRLMVVFDSDIAPTFSASDVLLTGPNGAVAVQSVQRVNGQTWELSMISQRANGQYDVRIGPDIADTAGNSLDQNQDGVNGAGDDTFQSSFTVQLANLQPSEISHSEQQLDFGETVELQWQEQNSGVVDVTALRRWQVWLSSDELLDATDRLIKTGESAVPVAHGSSIAVSTSFTVPLDNDRPDGSYRFLVVADSEAIVAESDEVDNVQSSAEIHLSRPPLPNLTLSQIEGPPTALPGDDVQVSWIVHNSGTLPAAGSWVETVYAVSDDPQAVDRVVGRFRYDEPIGAGEQHSRFETVRLPSTRISGNVHFRVEVDSDAELIEENELDNVLLGEHVTSVSDVLTVTTEFGAVTEGQSPATFRGFLTRSGRLQEGLVVSLTSDPSGEFVMPLEVVIPAGQSTVAFPITVLSDGIVDGNQSVTVTATAEGHQAAQVGVQVLDTDRPALTFELSFEPLDEGMSRTVTVQRGVTGTEPLEVQLTTDAGGQLALPTSVTIPAGGSAVSFQLVAVEDTVAEAEHFYMLRARASGHREAQVSLTVPASDRPQLTLTVDKSRFNESAGSFAATGTVRLSMPAPHDLLIRLAVNDHSELHVPASVTIPANQQEVTFAVSAVDDQSRDGQQTASITAMAIAGNGDILPETSVTADVVVLDDDGPTIGLSFERTVILAGLEPATTGTVTRPIGTAGAMTVALSSSHPTRVTLPDFVTLPAGSPSVTFSISTPANGSLSTDQSIDITASVDDPGIAMATAELLVTPRNVADLRLLQLESPAAAISGSLLQVRYEIENQGTASIFGAMLERVFLSRDPYPGDDTLLAQFLFEGDLAVGELTQRTVPIEAPRQLGDYWIIVQVDAGQAIEEIREGNNTAVSQRLSVSGAYSAQVQTEVEIAPTGTVIPLNGFATLAGSGEPAVHVPVSIHIHVEGTRRVFSTQTNHEGKFQYNFEPLPGEAGQYEIAAAHPGESRPAPQDSFSLLGLRASVSELSLLTVAGGPSRTAQVQLSNVTGRPLTDLAVEILDVPPGMTVTTALGGHALEGFASTTLVLDVTATSISQQPLEMTARVTTAEGAELRLPVIVQVVPLTPLLVSLSSPVKAGMVRGRQSIVTFEIVNQGGAAAEEVELRLPPEPWLQAASSTALGTLAPQETRTISLSLNPSDELPLGIYRGGLVIDATGGSWRMPFEFRLVSEAVGAVAFEVVDEYTFYVAGAPKVAGAHVTLFDAVSGDQKLAGVTDSQGRFHSEGVPEGAYHMLIEAPGHASLRSLVHIRAGETTELQPFLSREVVQYNFTVVPTDVADRTRIELQLVFETNVPVPVIVVEPGYIDFDQLEFVDGFVDLEFTLSNYGLVAAQDVIFDLPQHPNYEFFSLMQEVGVLPANSSLRIPVRIRDRTVVQGPSGAVLAGVIKADNSLVLADQTLRVTHIESGAQFFSAVLEDGTFLFEGLPEGSYRYDLENAVLASPPITQLEERERRESIRLLAVAGSTVSGIVGDADTGAPLAQFTVKLTAVDEDGKDTIVRTNDAGEYWFGDVAPGEYFLSVFSPAAELRYRAPITINEAQTVHSPLLPSAGSLQGTIVDAVTLAPVSDGSIVVENVGDQWPYASQLLSDGQFSLQGIPAGEYTLRVYREGYAEYSESVIVAGGQVGEFNISLTPLGGVHGQALTSTGDPLPRMTVIVQSVDEQVTRMLVTDSMGRYETEGLEPGDYTAALVTSGLDDILSHRFTVLAGQTISLPTLQVEMVKRVVGTITGPQNQPAQKATVRLLLEGETVLTTLSDEAGRFAFGILQPGTYRLTATTADRIYESVAVTVADGDTGEVAVQLRAGERTISGVVLGEDSAPIGEAAVLLRPSGGRSAATLEAQTTAMGEFSFANLPAGDYTLTLIKKNFATNQLSATVVDSDLTELSAVLVAATPFGGLITDSAGQPVAGAVVIASQPDSGTVVATAISDTEGRFEFDSLGSSGVNLRIVADGYLPATAGPIDPADQTTSISVVLDTSANSLSGVVRRADGQILEAATLTAIDLQGQLIAQVESDPSGGYRFDSLPATQLVVRVEALGFNVSEVTVEIDESAAGTRDVAMHPVAYDLGQSVIDAPLNAEGEREPVWSTLVLVNLYRSFDRRADEPSRPEFPPDGCCTLDYQFALSRWEDMNFAYDKIDVRQDELQSQFFWSMLRAAGLGFDLTVEAVSLYLRLFRAIKVVAQMAHRLDTVLEAYSLGRGLVGQVNTLFNAIRGRVEPDQVVGQAVTVSGLLQNLWEKLQAGHSEVLRLSERLAYDPDYLASHVGALELQKLGRLAGDILGIAGIALTLRDTAEAVVEEGRKIGLANLQLKAAIELYHFHTDSAIHMGQRYEDCLRTCRPPCEGPDCQDDDGGEDGSDDDLRGGPCVIYGGVRWSLHCGGVDIHYRARTTWGNASDLCERISGGINGGHHGTGRRLDPIVHPPRQLRDSDPNCNQIEGEGEGSDQGICARVRIQLEQTAVMNREAFQAEVELANADPSNEIEELDIQLMVFTATGEAATLAFAIRDPRLTGIDSLDGSGRIPVGQQGSARWTILPSIEAATGRPTRYFVGGFISYSQAGAGIRIELDPVEILVYPNPELRLSYFQQRDVYADDPFTPELEPREPFSLGLIVHNVGAGSARDLRIESAQPRIVENVKGLDTSFTIIGSQVDGRVSKPSLTLDLGDIAPGQAKVGQWIFTTPLQGHFIDYQATFTHQDSLDSGVDISLVRSVEVFELIRPVFADSELDDGRIDFLTNDLDDPQHLPDTLHLSDGTVEIVGLLSGIAKDGVVSDLELEVELAIEPAAGWQYLRLADPGEGRYRLERVLRADGTEVLSQNFWQTDRTFLNRSERPIYEDVLHLLDYDPSGDYRLIFVPKDVAPPTVVAISGVTPDPLSTPVDFFDVEFSGPIDPASFGIEDLVLNWNGGDNLIDDGVTIVQQTDTAFRITGLESLTQADGAYAITIQASGVTNLEGVAGAGVVAESWIKSEAAPAVEKIFGVESAVRNKPLGTVDVTFTKAINLASLTDADLLLLRDGMPVATSGQLAIAQLEPRTYRIFGLDELTNVDADYELQISAAVVEGIDGLTGVGQAVVTWVMDTTPPTVQSSSPANNGVRNSPLNELQIEFTEAIRLSAVALSQLHLTRDGVIILMDDVVSVVQLDERTIEIRGLSAVTAADGNYSLQLDGSMAIDQAGNHIGSDPEIGWTLDTQPPASPTQITISPDAGSSAGDGLTNTRRLSFTGTVAANVRAVRVFNATTQQELAEVFSETNAFVFDLQLTADGFHPLEIVAIDQAGNVSSHSRVDVFVDTTDPVAQIPAVTTPPRGDAVDAIVLDFTEPIDDLTLAAFRLVRNGVAQPLDSAAILQQTAANRWKLQGIASQTTLPGSYELRLASDHASIMDAAGNKLRRDAQVQWLAEPRWQNNQNPFDVNRDGILAPFDALVGINRLNDLGAGVLPASAPSSTQFFYDTSGDGFHTPNDILRIFNMLNAASDPEGEHSPRNVSPSEIVRQPARTSDLRWLEAALTERRRSQPEGVLRDSSAHDSIDDALASQTLPLSSDEEAEFGGGEHSAAWVACVDTMIEVAGDSLDQLISDSIDEAGNPCCDH